LDRYILQVLSAAKVAGTVRHTGGSATACQPDLALPRSAAAGQPPLAMQRCRRPDLTSPRSNR